MELLLSVLWKLTESRSSINLRSSAAPPHFFTIPYSFLLCAAAAARCFFPLHYSFLLRVAALFPFLAGKRNHSAAETSISGAEHRKLMFQTQVTAQP